MKCSHAMLLIEKNARETLSNQEKSLVEKHLEECIDCRTYRQLLEKMLNALHDLKEWQ
ncbi:MAG: hypothetical protein PHT78_08200 [Desulfitobacteriaceae bacterium]|nr:hypothetical protein [Desulfitobacteriaceae bacterium]MDD4753211.1 hypothetical protein [Desulfitobacteriaceae bacterium]